MAPVASNVAISSQSWSKVSKPPLVLPTHKPQGRKLVVNRSLRASASAVEMPDTKADDGNVFLDVEKAYAESSFPIKPDELIDLAKDYLRNGNANIENVDSYLAEDFKFIGPVVGPLNKKEFVAALGRINFKKAFPDMQNNFFGFHVDPMDPGRVWFMTRSRGTQTGPLFGAEPTGKKYEGPPELLSVTYNADKKITKQTVGVVGDRTEGNTGGLGALFGMLYAVGKPLPFPEAQPWKKSWRYALFQWLGSLRS